MYEPTAAGVAAVVVHVAGVESELALSPFAKPL